MAALVAERAPRGAAQVSRGAGVALQTRARSGCARTRARVSRLAPV